MMNPAEFANIAAAEKSFWWYRGMREILFSLLDPIAREQPEARVVEAGCGTGYLSRVLAERYRWTLFPLDIGAEGLAYARRYGVPRVVQGDATALPFRESAFDLVLSIDVIAHLQRGREHPALAEAYRTLRSGGRIVLRTSAFDVLRSCHSAFAGEEQRFTRQRLVAAVENAGFRVERVTYINTVLLPVALLKFRVWEPLTRQKAASGVQPIAPWLDRLLFAPLAWESRWIAKGGGFPAGQSLVLVGRKH
jgi:SAM-dependent methyltransferase